MSDKHTPEPWQLLPEECDKPYIRIRGTVWGGRYKIANVLTPYHKDVPPSAVQETHANARRIVACVNACRGLSTDELEQKGLVAAVGTQLLAADDRAEDQEREIRRLARVASNAENELADALNQRDGLRDAIGLAMTIVSELSQDENLSGHTKGTLTGLAEGLRMRVASARGEQ